MMGSNRDGNLAIEQVKSCTNVTTYIKDYLLALVVESDANDRFGKPMFWIGIYVALASLYCLVAMVADLFHGLRNNKLWFPCKYFTINAASLTIIAVAMKLPMDLNAISKIPKLGSMAFMCAMMAQLLPSLATLDTKQLVTNIIALGVLVITLVVDVCIQITTGVLFYSQPTEIHKDIVYGRVVGNSYTYRFFPIIYVAMLLMLLIIYASSSVVILKSKQILESKYQANHHQLQLPERLTVDKLEQLVINYWIMAETGNPQFMTSCFATTSAAGVISAINIVLLLCQFLQRRRLVKEPKSDYKWSLKLIFAIQYFGVLYGSLVPIYRYFTPLNFKMSIKWIWNHIKVFRVERYWTQKLSDWKQTSIPFPFRSRKCKVFIQKLKVLILNFCIAIQKAIVIACKMIGLLPVLSLICVLYCLRWLEAMFSAIGLVSGRRLEQQVQSDEDLRRYVLLLEDDMELAEATLTYISNSVKRLIRKAEKQQPNNLMKLVEKSRGNFEGVEKYSSHLVPPLLAQEFPDCWSLTLVTLTTIAISLPNIQHNEVDSLLSGVSEGLVYVTLVEESLNATDDYVTIQKAAKSLWLEVEVYHKWLANKLQQKHASQVNTAGGILRWFKDTARNMVTEVESTDTGGASDESIYRSISANLMYRITETILLSYHTDIEEVSQEEVFEQLSSMISDILAACLTNLPKVIAIKCHTSAIEKREASVHAAAQLLGETKQIINNLEDRQLPSLNPNELAFIDNWRAYLQHP